MSGTKKILFVNRKAPHGTIFALECLDVVLIGAAFDQDISIAFLDDGVFQLTRGQNTEAIGVKNFSPTFRALGDFGVTRLYVEKESLEVRGLTQDSLQQITYEDENNDWMERPSIRVVSRAGMADIMSGQDVILSF